ncbi:MAG: TIGR02265 family protein [Myxococcaceae bacterium]
MTQTYGRYQLVRKLAVGGMGEVWLARQKGPVGFEKLVVVKRLLPHLSAEQEFINMFFDEARIAAVLNHPNIAQIYDLGEVNGEYYIAMEYVHGQNLRVVAQQALDVKGGTPMALKCRVLADAAAALDFAHRAKSPSGQALNLIHRDISPQNIIIGFSGAVKLIDFGVAKAAGKLAKTATGVIKGKYAYMSPEQAKGEELDLRSDIFGLGIVFYEILASQRLFKRDNDTDTLKAVVYEKIPPPSAHAKGIPKAVDAIVMKALERKRDDRYQTAGEMQLALEEFLVRQRLPATPAHLAAFMRELFPDEAAQGGADEPTQSTSDSGSPLSAPSMPVHDKKEPPPKPAPSKPPAGIPKGSQPGRKGVTIRANPQELEARINSCGPADQVNGFFFNALFGLCMRLVGPSADHDLRTALQQPRSFVDALAYPTPELLRLMWKAVELTAPVAGSVETAFEDMGVWVMDGFLRNPLGRPVEQLKGKTPTEVLKALMVTLKQMMTPGERIVSPNAKGVTLILKGEVLPVQFHLGLVSAALDRLCGLKTKASWDKTAADRIEIQLSW